MESFFTAGFCCKLSLLTADVTLLPVRSRHIKFLICLVFFLQGDPPEPGAVEDVELIGQRAGGTMWHPEEALQQLELRGQRRHSDDTEVQVLTDKHKTCSLHPAERLNTLQK